MRADLEKIKKIEDYLLGRMEPAEKESFREALEKDSELAAEVEAQRILMERLRLVALRGKIRSAHRRNAPGRRGGIGNTRLLVYITAAVVVVGIGILSYRTFLQRVSDYELIASYIKPPFEGVDVPFHSDTISSGAANILTYATGSMLLIPDSAFVDENGSVVEGKVEVHFREFSDAIDLFISGIPMDYQVDSSTYQFESASMCEIRATYQGEEVKLRDGKKIEVIQSSYTDSDVFNLYRFNETSGQWEDRGKDVPVDVSAQLQMEMEAEDAREEAALNDYVYKPNAVEPVKPRKASGRLFFRIKYEESKYPELEGFKDVLFEIDESITKFRKGDNEIVWEDVNIDKGIQDGIYMVNFSKKSTGQTASYAARPVFKDQQYQDAMEVYDRKLAEYKEQKTKRIKKENLELKRLQAERRRIDSINMAIELRNLAIIKRNREIDSLNKVRMQEIQVLKENRKLAEIIRKRQVLLNSLNVSVSVKEKLVFDELNKETLLENKTFIEKEYQVFREVSEQNWDGRSMRNSLVRSYTIDGFGIWNTDAPIEYPDGIRLFASFEYEGIQFLSEVILMDKNIRALYPYPLKNQRNFKFSMRGDNVLWVVRKNKLYYFNDFNEISSKQDNSAYTFQMKAMELPVDNYEEVRKAMESL